MNFVVLTPFSNIKMTISVLVRIGINDPLLRTSRGSEWWGGGGGGGGGRRLSVKIFDLCRLSVNLS